MNTLRCPSPIDAIVYALDGDMAKIQSFNAADLEFSHVGVKIVCLPQSKISDRKLDALKKSVNKFVSWEDLQSQEDTIA